MARRVNTRFLIILTTALAVLIVGALATLYFMNKRRGNPEEYLANADKLMAAKDYEKALANLRQATGLRPNDPAMWVRYGDAHSKLAGLDHENMIRATACWRKALEIDPNNKDALQRMLTICQAQIEHAAPRELPTYISETRDYARKLVQADPSNLQVAAIEPQLAIRGWMNGIATDRQQVEAAIAKLKEISGKNPSDADAAFWASAATLQLGREEARDRRLDEARKRVNDAEAMMINLAKAQSDNALVQLRTGELLLASRDFVAIKGASTAPSTTLPAAEVSQDPTAEVAVAATQPGNRIMEHVQLAQKYYNRAAELADAKHPDYVEIETKAAALQQQMGQRGAAEKALRDVMANAPDSQEVRLQLARLLSQDPSKRAQAIEVLDKPVNPEALPGVKGFFAQPLKIQTLVTMTSLRLDEYSSSTDDAERKKLMTAVDDGISKVAAMVGGGQDNPFVLRMRGKQQRAQGKIVESIQTMNRAMTLLDQQDATDDELLELLARSYVDSGETGQAKTLIKKVLDRSPGNIQVRLLMAQLLLREGNAVEARTHVDFLDRILPDSPELAKLKLATIDLKAHPADAQALYASLPEQSRMQKLEKAAMAGGMGNRAEAVRLLEAIRTETPGDVDASIALARLYAADEKPKAIAVIDAALKANPDNNALLMFQKQLADASPEELRKFQRELVAKSNDPFSREMALYQLSRNEQKNDEALKHLQEAERLKPQERSVLDEFFNYHLSQGNWDEAAKYVEKLVAQNADQAGGLLYRFRLAMARGDSAKGLAYAQELTTKLPEFAQSWLSLARAEQATGKLDDALEHYQLALQKQNENADALRGLIDCNYAKGNLTEAKRYIDQAIRVLPNNPIFREAETNYELSYGDVGKALAAREAALTAQPDNLQAYLADARSHLVAAARKVQRSETATAEQYAQRALEISQQAVEKFPEDPAPYASLAESAIQAKHQEQGEAALKKWAADPKWKDRTEPRTLLAQFYSRVGRLQDAENVLRELRAARPDDVNIQLGLSELLGRQGKADEAAKVLAEGNAADPRIVQRRIELEITAGKLDEADQHLQAALKDDPKSVNLLALSGFVNISRQKWDDATARLKSALAIAPNSIQAQYYLALVKIQQPKPELDEAIRLLTAVCEQNPDHADARFTLGQTYRRRNESANAIRELEAALKLQPTNKTVRLTLATTYTEAVPPRWNEVERTLREGRALPGFAKDAELLRAEAIMWSSRRDPAKAKASMQEAMAAAPNSPPLVRDYINILLQARDHAAVITECDKVLAGKDDPSLWWAYQARGVARKQAGDKEGALKDLESALTHASALQNDAASTEVLQTISREIGVDEALARVMQRTSAEPRWFLIAAYLQQQKGDLDASIAMIEQALAKMSTFDGPTQRNVLRTAGTLYLTRSVANDANKAYDAYLKLLDLEPDDLATLNNMACLLADSIQPPRYAEARTYSQRAYDLMIAAGRPEPLLLDTHGWVLTLNGQVDQGAELIRQAIAVKPFVEGHYHLAEAYLRQSSPQEAEKQLALASESIRQTEEAKGIVPEGLKRLVEDAKIRAQQQIQKQQAKAGN